MSVACADAFVGRRVRFKGKRRIGTITFSYKPRKRAWRYFNVVFYHGKQCRMFMRVPAARFDFVPCFVG